MLKILIMPVIIIALVILTLKVAIYAFDYHHSNLESLFGVLLLFSLVALTIFLAVINEELM